MYDSAFVLTFCVQLEDESFDKLFHSPLKRAADTAKFVWGTAEEPVRVLSSLREVDLYSFQGLLKAEGQDKFGEEFAMWQGTPEDFEIDGHQPIRELWYRASLVWQQILSDQDVASCALVVAHNAVNQAMIATAIGLGPSFFRRLLQSNAASTVLDFVPRSADEPPVVTIDRLNQVRTLHATKLHLVQRDSSAACLLRARAMYKVALPALRSCCSGDVFE